MAAAWLKGQALGWCMSHGFPARQAWRHCVSLLYEDLSLSIAKAYPATCHLDEPAELVFALLGYPLLPWRVTGSCAW